MRNGAGRNINPVGKLKLNHLFPPCTHIPMKNTGNKIIWKYAKTWKHFLLIHSNEVNHMSMIVIQRITPVNPGIVVPASFE